MNQLYTYTIAMLLCCFLRVTAQLDTVQQLPEILLSDTRLQDFKQGINVQEVADTIVQQYPGTLTALLREHSGVYFRENGLAGVSSASFRGTSAQQTAVIWNGVNINSQLTGQTDFNAIHAQFVDDLSVRHGGGSIAYGSGAVGGSIHLSNTVSFGKAENKNTLTLGYGSFDTPSGQWRSTVRDEQYYVDIGVGYVQSENNFDYINTDQKNDNGAFNQTTLHLTGGIQIGDRAALKLYHDSFLGDREFAGTLTAVSDDAYEDRTSRTQLVYTREGRWRHTLRVAHIFEQFRYFPSGFDAAIYDFGKANRLTTQYESNYTFDNTKTLELIADYTTVTASGSSITSDTRNVFSVVGLYKQQLNDRFTYAAQVRYEGTAVYDNVLLGGVGAEYAFAKAYTFTFNASRNYRVPSFNDVYWQGPGAVGNPELQPETSYQAEIGNVLRFKNTTLRINGFYIQSQDLIAWQPDPLGVWSPNNVQEAENYGAEVAFQTTQKWGTQRLDFDTSYSYVEARNRETGNALIYVPNHNWTSRLGWQRGAFSAFVQSLLTSQVFTTTDESAPLDGYAVFNGGVQWNVWQRETVSFYVGLQGRNLFNTNYQIVNARPMPGRNFLIQTRYTF